MANKTINRTCETCGGLFLAERYEIRRGRARFCSIKCANSSKRGIPHKYPRCRTSPREFVFSHCHTVPHCGCWIWDGKPTNRGYGVVKYNGNRTSAHRFSWAAFNEQDIPDGMVVMHSCDTPLCVNPEHLRIGTPADNVHDMMRKGRSSFGGKGGVCVPRTPKHIVDSVRNDEGTLMFLANKYGISQGTVYNIRNRINKCYKET